MKNLFILLLVIGLVACGPASTTSPAIEPRLSVTPAQPTTRLTLEATRPTTQETVPAPSPSATSVSPEEAAWSKSIEAMNALQQRDLEQLAETVHPIQGLRFSPYSYVQESHLVFSADQLAGLLEDPQIYTWGAFDGSGLPIELTFAEYYERFIYDQDFANAEQIAINEIIGQGNTLNNISDFYPGAIFIEYHFPGFDPAYEGMDWVSLRLVFQEEKGIWYLVGIIHDEWTI